MAGRKLTRALVERAMAEAPAGSERYAFDTIVPGFGLRVRAGRGSYVYQYRAGGRTRRVKLGDAGALTLEQARELARRKYATVKSGGDPSEERREERRRKLAVGELLELYLADLEQRVRLGARRGRRSTLSGFRALAGGPLASLARLEVEKLDVTRLTSWHRGLAATPAQANRAATLLSAALGFGERRGLVTGPNPCRRLDRFEERPRAERLSLAEVGRVGAALRAAEAAGSIHPSAALALRLLLLCGLRRSEVIAHALRSRRSEGDGLRWGDVDLDVGVLSLRRAKAGDRRVLLGGAAIEALRRARPADADPSAPVCPGELAGAPLVGFEKAARRLFDRAGVAWKGSHAFRRTFASVAAEQGLGEYLVGALLGHRSGSVTSRYVAPGADPLRAAAERVSAEIAAALDGRAPAPVLDLGAARQDRAKRSR